MIHGRSTPAYITCQRFETLCHFTKGTALRQFKRLVDEGRQKKLR